MPEPGQNTFEPGMRIRWVWNRVALDGAKTTRVSLVDDPQKGDQPHTVRVLYRGEYGHLTARDDHAYWYALAGGQLVVDQSDELWRTVEPEKMSPGDVVFQAEEHVTAVTRPWGKKVRWLPTRFLTLEDDREARQERSELFRVERLRLLGLRRDVLIDRIVWREWEDREAGRPGTQDPLLRDLVNAYFDSGEY